MILTKPCKLVWKSLNNGYPLVTRNGKTVRLTRVVLEQKLGRPIKPKHDCCHHCDTKNCVEPEHLWEGTRRQNIRDCWDKGRRKSWGHI